MDSNATNSSSGKKFHLSPLLALGLVVFTATLAFTVYVAFGHSSTETELKIKESSIEEIKAQIVDLDNKGLTKAVSAGKIIDRLDDKFFKWSSVMQKIQNTVPKDSQGNPKIQFLSYAGGSDGSVNITTRTLASSLDPYGDTAKLLKAFNGSPHFADAFIPSISKTSSNQGGTILSYTFQFKYLGEQLKQPVSRKK